MNGVTLNKETNEITVSEMKDGQIGIITNWCIKEYVSTVVQRYDNHLVSIGFDAGKSWNNYFEEGLFDSKNKVRILQPGETITIN